MAQEDRAGAAEDAAVLVLAPHAKDAKAMCEFLADADIAPTVCADMHQLCEELAGRPRAALLTEEALTDEALSRLVATRAALAGGTELPVLVLIAPRREPSPKTLVRRYAQELPGATLIVRPVHPVALLSAVHTALEQLARRERALATSDASGRSRADEGEARLLEALKHVPVILFEQDVGLRYGWTYNPYAPDDLTGRRDADWLTQPAEVEAFEALKRSVLESGTPARERVRLTLSDGPHAFDVVVEPRRDAAGRVVGIAGAALRVDEHVALQEQLRRQVEQLARMDQRKNDFIAQLAHELRNPLAPIYNALHVLRIQPQPPDPVHLKWATEVIGRQLHQLTRLVEDLLDIARVSHGSLQLRAEPVELGRALMQAIETTRPLATARKQTLNYSPPVEPVRVRADPARLQQIVCNLLNNASRYTPSGGHISLSVRRERGHAVINVVDNGLGIAPEVLPHIFEPFYQASRDAAPAQGGLGLGLTLVRRLVELHEGSVEAESAGPGKGSRFTVRLPLLHEPAPTEIPPVPHRASGGLRVLVVDDDADVAQSFVLLLRMMGHEAEAANDAASALARAASFRPRVVFVDIALPDMDGYQLARALRAAAAPGASLFLVAVTGYARDDIHRRAAAAGFDAHLLKPATAEAVEQLLASLKE